MRLCFNQSWILLKCQRPVTGSRQERAGGSEQAPGTCHSLPGSYEAQHPVSPPLVTFENSFKKYTALLAAGWSGLLYLEFVHLALGPAGLRSGLGVGAGRGDLEAVVHSWDFFLTVCSTLPPSQVVWGPGMELVTLTAHLTMKFPWNVTQNQKSNSVLANQAVF